MTSCNTLKQGGERLKFQVSAWHVAGGTLHPLTLNKFYDCKLVFQLNGDLCKCQYLATSTGLFDVYSTPNSCRRFSACKTGVMRFRHSQLIRNFRSKSTSRKTLCVSLFYRQARTRYSVFCLLSFSVTG